MAPVFIVNDEWAICKMVREMLTLEGYEALYACSGEEAWRILCRLPCRAVVLLDLSLPPPDGREVYLRLRAIPHLRARYAVILYDNHVWLENAGRGLDVDGTLAMPNTYDALLETVQRGQRLLSARPGDRRFDNLKHIRLL